MIAVDLICDIRSPSGYSAHAREFARAIEPYVDLRLVEQKHDSTSVVLDPDTENLFSTLEAKTRDPQVRIEFQTPEFYSPRDGVLNIGFTQWETTGIYDSDTIYNPTNPSLEGNTEARFNWVNQMNSMDVMFTACSSARDAFVASGVTRPVYIVQGPMDITTYSPDSKVHELHITDINLDRKTKEWIPRAERPTVIGCVAQWTIRKNMDALVTAVLSRFERNDVTLLLKTYGATSGSRNEADKLYDHIRMRRRVIGNQNAPRIVLITEKLTDEQMVAVYKSIDIYCSTSRGEGFCMPIVQGMASGVVPVSCGFSAPADYIEHYSNLYNEGNNGFLVDYTLAPAVGQMHTPWYTHKQDWGNVDVGDLIRQLKKAVEIKTKRPEVWARLQANARETVVTRMAPDVIGQQVAGLIEGMV